MKYSFGPIDLLLVFDDGAPAPPPEVIGRLWSRTSLLKEFLAVVRGIRTWTGATIRSDRRGLCLSLDRMTLGHLRWDGRVVLPFPPDVRQLLIESELAFRDPDPLGGGGGGGERLVFAIRNEDDAHRWLWVFRLAHLVADLKDRRA